VQPAKHNPYKPLWGLFLIILVVSVITALGKLREPKDKIAWRTDFASAQDESRQSKKPALLYFTATWCGPCQRMASETFAKAEVETALQQFVPIKIDIDKDRSTTERYQIDGVPTFALIDDDGRVVKQITGGMDATDFLAWLGTSRRLP
jgi:thiol:disulfide interchange protein